MTLTTVLLGAFCTFTDACLVLSSPIRRVLKVGEFKPGVYAPDEEVSPERDIDWCFRCDDQTMHEFITWQPYGKVTATCLTCGETVDLG